MSIFSRRRAAPAPMPAPPPPAPVAQPAMPNPYLRNLSPAQPQQGRVGVPQPMDFQQRLMQQAQPSLSDAIALGKAGDQAGMQRMMQQIVGLPPSGAPQQPGMTPAQAALGKPGFLAGQMPQGEQRASPFDDAARQQISQALRDQVQATEQRGPFAGPMGPQQPGFLGSIQPGQMAPLGGMPAGQQFAGNPMEMQQAAQQYAQMQMQQRQFPQPGQMGPQRMVNPQSNDALKQQFLAQQGIYQPMPAYQSPAQETQQKMMMAQMAKQASMQQQQMGPQQPGLTPMPFPQPGMQPQQPNSLGQQFGQAQNPFARPLQPQQPNSPGQQQTGPFAGPAKLQQLGTAPQQPGMQPQQPGMQQNSPMQKAGGSTGRAGLF